MNGVNTMWNYIKSLFVRPTVEQIIIVNLHLVDEREDEDSITHGRVMIPCPKCKRSMVVTFKCMSC